MVETDGKGSPRQDLHPHLLRSERSASALDYVGGSKSGAPGRSCTCDRLVRSELRYGSVKVIRPRATEPHSYRPVSDGLPFLREMAQRCSCDQGRNAKGEIAMNEVDPAAGTAPA